MDLKVGEVYEVSDDAPAWGHKRIWREEITHVELGRIETKKVDGHNYLGLCGFVTGDKGSTTLYFGGSVLDGNAGTPAAETFIKKVRCAQQIRAEDEDPEIRKRAGKNPFVRDLSRV